MPRVTPLPSTALPPPIAEVYERFAGYGPFADQAAVLAHVPSALDHLCRMLMELKARKAVPWRYIELSIVVVSKLNACAYCVAHHSPVLAIEGSVGRGDRAASECRSSRFRRCRPAGDRICDAGDAKLRTHPRTPCSSGLRLHFSEAQIVELTLRIALTGFFNRFNDALSIDDGAAVAALGELSFHPAHPTAMEIQP